MKNSESFYNMAKTIYLIKHQRICLWPVFHTFYGRRHYFCIVFIILLVLLRINVFIFSASKNNDE